MRRGYESCHNRELTGGVKFQVCVTRGILQARLAVRGRQATGQLQHVEDPDMSNASLVGRRDIYVIDGYAPNGLYKIAPYYASEKGSE